MKFWNYLMGAAMSRGRHSTHSANEVLKGSQVTESALIEALAIEGPEAASGATRGFRPAAACADGRPPRSRGKATC